MKWSGGAHASRVQVRASRPNRWLNRLVWDTVFGATPKTATGTVALPTNPGLPRDAGSFLNLTPLVLATKKLPCGAATNLGPPCSSRRILPCPVGESAVPAFGGLVPWFSHGAKPKPPPVAAGCGARGRHTVHTGQAPLGAGWLQPPAEKKLRAGVARPSPAASAGGVSPPVPTPGGTPGQPAGGTPALQGSRKTMPRRRRWGVAQASAPAGCGSVPLPVHGRAATRGGTPLKPAAGTATLQALLN